MYVSSLFCQGANSSVAWVGKMSTIWLEVADWLTIYIPLDGIKRSRSIRFTDLRCGYAPYSANHFLLVRTPNDAPLCVSQQLVTGPRHLFLFGMAPMVCAAGTSLLLVC